MMKDESIISLNDNHSVIRKQLEQCQNTAYRCQKIIDAIPDGVLYVDRDRKIIVANSAISQLFNCGTSELIGKRTESLYCNPDDFDTLGEKISTLTDAGQMVSYDAQFCRRDGTPFKAEVVVSTVEDPRGEMVCFIKTMRDISERKRLEESLEKLQLKFRTIADSTYDWECWEKLDGSYNYISPSCERITGYKPEEFIEDLELFHRLIHPQDRDFVMNHHESEIINQDMEILHFQGLQKHSLFEDQYLFH